LTTIGPFFAASAAPSFRGAVDSFRAVERQRIWDYRRVEMLDFVFDLEALLRRVRLPYYFHSPDDYSVWLSEANMGSGAV